METGFLFTTNLSHKGDKIFVGSLCIAYLLISYLPIASIRFPVLFISNL